MVYRRVSIKSILALLNHIESSILNLDPSLESFTSKAVNPSFWPLG